MKKVLSLAVALLISVLAMAQVRVMSYNVRYGAAKDGENSWDKRKAATPAMLREIKPDVFGVQEALTFQLDYITENCPEYKCVGVGREDGKDGGEHMSVFYNSEKIDLLEWGTYWLSETPQVPSFGWDAACKRTATWTRLKVKKTGEEFFFVNTHLDHKGFEAREKGLMLLVERISAMNPNGVPVVLTGDFNITPDAEELEGLNRIMKSARGYAKHADPNGSYNGYGAKGKSKGAPTLRKEVQGLLPIDYIYYAGFEKCKRFVVVTKEYNGIKYISDHYPVYADLK
ncbi:MAG: endonuclease/exonuclease/phosphatase family protein [Bacteroidaceae bacterium]|nr:endonuclease/exonuclease/phosphatase family protein [Bacteroidales bacterium]MCF0184871.1 endonuclease/exonuclease/phosphatase family protein [Bacteroidaceae bacterium]